jgi:hypothetical protein
MDMEQKRDFRFEDLALFDDCSIQKTLREINRDQIAAALSGALAEINNLALKGEVCCSHKVLQSGFNTFLNALKGGVWTRAFQSARFFIK